MGTIGESVAVAPQAESAPAVGEAEAPFDALGFLATHGIESLGVRTVQGHDGNPMPLTQALTECPSARAAFEGAVEMIKDMGAEDVLAPMSKYMNKLSAQAQSPEAKKKEI